MKKILMIAGGFALVISIAIIALIVYAVVKGPGFDQESQRYVDAAVPAIVSTWDKQALIDRSSPELMKAVKDKGDDWDKLFNFFRKLGHLKKYKGATGAINYSVTTQDGKVVTAIYHAEADFESGPAEIVVLLVKHDQKWQIAGFTINSKAFLN
jgi:hypothetical protein